MAAIGGWAGLPVVSVRRTRGLIGASPPALRARAKGLPAPPANNLCVSAPLREAGFFYLTRRRGEQTFVGRDTARMAAIGGWPGLPVVSVLRATGPIGASPPALRARARGLPAPPANNLCVSAPLREAGFFYLTQRRGEPTFVGRDTARMAGQPR